MPPTPDTTASVSAPAVPFPELAPAGARELRAHGPGIDKRKENLAKGTPFLPGADPRRAKSGRKKARPIVADMLRNIGRETLPRALREKLKGQSLEFILQSKSMVEALCRATYLRALNGEAWAVQLIFDRTDGKVSDKLQIENGGRLQIVEEIVDAGTVHAATAAPAALLPYRATGSPLEGATTAGDDAP